MKEKPLPIAILLLALLFLVLLTFSNSNAAGALDGEIICLDPGHGGSDPGAVNAEYGLKESDINLDVSFALKYLFEGQDAEVVMTRSIDKYLTNADRYTFCNEQKATILISVHTNSVTNDEWDGSMALHAPNRDPYLAEAIYEVMYPFLRDTAPVDAEDFTDWGLDNFASGVLFKCDMPAAMMEPLLMSNADEAPLLVKPVFTDPAAGEFNADCTDFSCRRGQIAEAIYLGTLNYFSNQSGAALHVDAIDMSYEQSRSTFFINSVVAIQDSSEEAVSTAEVTVQFTMPDGSVSVETAVTGSDGTADFRIRTKAAGIYELAVLDIVKSGWLYDTAVNVESSEILTVP